MPIKSLQALLLTATLSLLGANNALAYDVEADSINNTIYLLLENPNPGAVYHSISIGTAQPTFVGAASTAFVPSTVPGARSRLAAVNFDIINGAALGSSGDIVLTLSGIAAGQTVNVDIAVPLTVVSTAPAAQGIVGSTVPVPDADGPDSDGDGTVDSLEIAYGSDPANAASTPGQSNLPSEQNIPALLWPAYLILASLLIGIGAAPVIQSRKLRRRAGIRLRSTALVLLTATTLLSTSENSAAGAATRIQLLASLPDLDSLSLEITNGTSISASASTSGVAGGASSAVDGQLATRWESAHGIDPSWLSLDLGAEYELSEIVIYWEAANAETYDIQGSNDNSNWSTLASESGGTFGDRIDSVQVGGVYRYVRVLGLTRSQGNNWGYSIYEVEVHGFLPLLNDADNDGVDDSRDQCAGTAADTIVGSDGCEPGVYAGYDAPTSYPGLSLAWSDEFNGASLDAANWTHEIGNGCPNLCGWGNNELQYYRAENTTVANGVLTIKAKEENFGGSAYTSSRLKTQGKQFFRYGRIDIRAVLPAGTGLWPALWMLGENITTVGWPASGEIDIMELRGNEPNKYLGTAHWSDNGNYALYGSECAAPNCADNSPVLPSGTFANEFHVFSIVWTSSSIQWYLDGATQPFHTIDITPASLSEFREDFFLLFNVAVGGNFLPNPTASTQFPQSMVVDYIRVYQ
nr:putative F5_F8_type_C and GH16_laminarinase_like domain-containing protein [uncultured bacterium]